MFGVGWTEMLVIGVVALIVIGPKDLPMVMNRLGKVIASVRRMGSEFQREINKTTGLDQITDLRRSLTEPLKQTAAEITREFNKITPSGDVVPSGAIAPSQAGTESVVDAIHSKIGLSTPAAPSLGETKPVESPAPKEAIAPAAPVSKPRAKKSAAADAAPTAPGTKPKKPAASRPPKSKAGA